TRKADGARSCPTRSGSSVSITYGSSGAMRAIAIVSVGMLVRRKAIADIDRKRGTHDHASQIHEHPGGRPGPGAEILYRETGLQGRDRSGDGPGPALDRTSAGKGGKPAGAFHHGWRGRPGGHA